MGEWNEVASNSIPAEVNTCQHVAWFPRQHVVRDDLCTKKFTMTFRRWKAHSHCTWVDLCRLALAEMECTGQNDVIVVTLATVGNQTNRRTWCVQELTRLSHLSCKYTANMYVALHKAHDIKGECRDMGAWTTDVHTWAATSGRVHCECEYCLQAKAGPNKVA